MGRFRGPIIPFGSLVEYSPFWERPINNPSIWKRKSYVVFFFGYGMYAGRIWKGDMLVADVEELETIDASEIFSKRLSAKEVIFPKEDGKFIVPVVDG